MEIYKTGQGNWARAMVAIAAGLLVLFGVSEMLDSVTGTAKYVTCGIILAVIGGGGIYFSFFNRKMVDFLIDTQAEMKKVAWPPWTEVKGSTWVVITTVIVMGGFLYAVDALLGMITQVIGILPKV